MDMTQLLQQLLSLSTQLLTELQDGDEEKDFEPLLTLCDERDALFTRLFSEYPKEQLLTVMEQLTTLKELDQQIRASANKRHGQLTQILGNKRKGQKAVALYKSIV